MAAVHILIFGEMAGFKIAIHVKMIFFFSWSYEKKKKKFSQSELANLHANN